MANPTYHNGADGRAFILPPSGTNLIEAAVTKWDMTIKGNNLQASNAKDGRYRFAGVVDADGSLSMHLDTSNLPFTVSATSLSLRAGQVIGLALLDDGATPSSTDPTDSFRLNAIIDEVHPSSEFEGSIDLDIKFSLQQGSSLKYPGDA
ncbi:MAG: hypothetical protein P4L84_11150 [Isosphaeraceae bacterium]|nr:hypothetical protein [Isosphaeraceae bacterium]